MSAAALSRHSESDLTCIDVFLFHWNSAHLIQKSVEIQCNGCFHSKHFSIIICIFVTNVLIGMVIGERKGDHIENERLLVLRNEIRAVSRWQLTL